MKRRRRGSPTLVGKVVGQVLDDLGLDAAAKAFRISRRWESAVGREIARHCRPVAMRGNVLETVVDTSVWCQQLQLQSPEILAALQEELGDQAPCEIHFRVGYVGAR